MYFLIKNRLKKVFIVIQLLFLTGSLHGAGYVILDSENLITDEQKKKIAKAQEQILQEKDTLVSYGFHHLNSSSLGIRTEWDAALKKAVNDGADTDKFHLLIYIEVLSTQINVDVFYKNPPVLEDFNDLNICISSLRQSIGGEPDLEALINNAPSIIKDRLAYLNERPEFEKQKNNTFNKARAEHYRKYITGIVKIAVMITIPIVVILASYYIIVLINRRKTYYFPVAPRSNPRRRLGAPHAATSISQMNNKFNNL